MFQMKFLLRSEFSLHLPFKKHVKRKTLETLSVLLLKQKQRIFQKRSTLKLIYRSFTQYE